MRSKAQEDIRQHVISLFHSDEDQQQLSVKFGVCTKAIRSWWVSAFGTAAVRTRGKSRNIVSNESRGRPITGVKRCPGCNEVKLLEQFNKNQTKRDGHRDRCAVCEAESSKQYREALSSEDKISLLNYRKDYNKRYYAEHAESARQYSQAYRQNNVALVSAREKQYFERNPELLLLKNAYQRAQCFEIPFAITAKDILNILPKDARCPITLEPFERGVGKVGPRSMTLDRIIPNLGYVVTNIAVINHRANTMKSNCIDPEVFRRVAAFCSASSYVPLVHNVHIRGKYTQDSPEMRMFKSARQRAKEKGIPFEIIVEDVHDCIPNDGRCPITREFFGLGSSKAGPRSMSLDRINPDLGYVLGNMAVISHLANTIKQNCVDPSVFLRLAIYVETGKVR